MNKRYVPILIILFALLAGLLLWNLSKEESVSPNYTGKDTILFYGKECPHCQEVEKFIDDNKIAEKVSFDSLEVWHDKANSQIMMEKAKECGISQDQLGVPFLWSNGKCFMGGPEVEKFFKDKAGI